MKIKLKNYCDKWSEHDIGETSDIVFAVLKELSGDEVLFVYRSGNRSEVYDSDTNGRHTDYDDGSCVVFSEGKWNEEFLRIHEVKALSWGAEPDVVSPKKASDAKEKDEPKRTRVTNAEKYKTAEERIKAFGVWHEEFCGMSGVCAKDDVCACAVFHWLELEAEDEKLLPCPGCGNADMHVHDSIQDSKVYIVCPNCGYSSPGEIKLESAVRRHNEIARAVIGAKKNGGKE